MFLFFWGLSFLLLLSDFMNALASAGTPRGSEKGTSSFHDLLLSHSTQNFEARRMNDFSLLASELIACCMKSLRVIVTD